MSLGANKAAILGASGGGETAYSIDQSIRFNPSDSCYMSRTQDTAASKQKFTFSWWMKLGEVDDEMVIISGGASSRWMCRFNTAQQLTFRLTNGTTEKVMTTDMKFRDLASWYHCVWTADCTGDISADYSVFYVNGERVAMTGTQPSADTDFAGYGDATTASIGCLAHALGVGDFNGYLAEMVLIDNQALTPSSFGELSDDGIWIPKDVSGLTFGTNGFWVDGRDSSDLGDDESGNGNDWSTSGLASNDQKPDTPTKNQITFNPLNNQRSGGTPSNGNLDYVGPSTRTMITLTANLPTSGKWCCAFKVEAVSNDAGWQIGVGYADDSDLGDAAGSNEDVSIIRMSTSSSDLEITDAIAASSIDPSQAIATGDEFWVAQDMGTGKSYLGIYDASATAMVWIANDAGLDGNPSAGTNETKHNSALAGSDNVVITVGSKASNAVYLQKSGDVSGTLPTGYTYFENVLDLIGS